MGRKVIRAMGGDVRGRTVALLGLTFKPNTDDMRDAPSLALVQALEDAGASVRTHDPQGHEQARPLLPNVQLIDDPYQAADGADALVIATEWDAFRALDLRRVAELLKRPVLVDLRNIYHPDEAARAGLRYTGVGRG